jgi:uncharacterized protein
MPESGSSASSDVAAPDYAALVRFLVEPFLELPDSLRVDCEVSPARGKVLVRLAFESADKGRVFGRGGRNIQAIRAVLEAAAQMAGYSAYLEVFGASPQAGEADESARSRSDRPRRTLDRGGERSAAASEPVSSKPRPRPIPKGSVKSTIDPAPANDDSSDVPLP